jgi:hypothetical protein
VISFIVTAINRRSSSQINTIHYLYDSEGKQESRIEHGAEWVEVEFEIVQENNPSIQIANVAGDAIIVGSSKVIINNSKLFDAYKIGDIIEFSPSRPLNKGVIES